MPRTFLSGAFSFVSAAGYLFAQLTRALPKQLANETLISYPISIDRQDIDNQFLTPAGVSPRWHKETETTETPLSRSSANPRGLLPKIRRRAGLSPLQTLQGVEVSRAFREIVDHIVRDGLFQRTER